MGLIGWRPSLHRLFASSSATRRATATPRNQGSKVRPRLEQLEDRLVPAAAFLAQPSTGFQLTSAIAITQPVAVAAGDFSLDGRPDLAAVSKTGLVMVFVNKTTPGATPLFGAARVVSSGAVSVAVGDVNDDGRPDLIVVTPAGAVRVLVNQTSPRAVNPSFAAPVTVVSAAAKVVAVAAGDFNNDGRNDIAVVERSGTVAMLASTKPQRSSALSFAPLQSAATVANAVGIATSDLNNDELPDLVIANQSNGAVSVLVNQTSPGAAAPSFQAPLQVSTGSGQALSVGTADLNSDGLLDVIVGTTAGVMAELNTTAPANSTPTFAPAMAVATGGIPVGLATADLSSVGRANIVVVGPAGNRLWLLQNAAWPAHVFAPYVDMTLWPTADLSALSKTPGVHYFSLGFIVPGANSAPTWGGYDAYQVGNSDFSKQMKASIDAVRAQGGDVTVSFGGEAGKELARSIKDVTKLEDAYRLVINTYSLTHIDFDLEGGAQGDADSIKRRWQAIAALQSAAKAAGRELIVSVTLPVNPTGLANDSLDVVQKAKELGVQLGEVNIMAMNYGDQVVGPNPDMGAQAIKAATSLFSQLRTVYGAGPSDAQIWRRISITAMIGLNNVTTETFFQANAQAVLKFAQQHGIGELAFWSLNRDHPPPGGKPLTKVEFTNSSILQTDFEFSGIFLPFTS